MNYYPASLKINHLSSSLLLLWLYVSWLSSLLKSLHVRKTSFRARRSTSHRVKLTNQKLFKSCQQGRSPVDDFFQLVGLGRNWRCLGSGSERAGGETLGQTRGEYWVSRGSAGANGWKSPIHGAKPGKESSVYSKLNVRARWVSPSLISPSSTSPLPPNTHDTHHRFGKASWLWGWLSSHSQCVDGKDHQGLMEE